MLWKSECEIAIKGVGFWGKLSRTKSYDAKSIEFQLCKIVTIILIPNSGAITYYQNTK